MTGVEGYVESASSGLVAGLNAARYALGLDAAHFDRESMTGALARYVSDPNVANFQPMNVNFGIAAPLATRVKGGKRARGEATGIRAIENIKVKPPNSVLRQPTHLMNSNSKCTGCSVAPKLCQG